MASVDSIAVATLASLVLFVAGATYPASGETVSEAGITSERNVTTPRIVEVAPNPVARGDRGEHVVIAFPEPTDLWNWSIDDGEGAIALPNRTVSGRVAFASDPDAVVGRETVIGVDGGLALANAGETIRLRRGTATVSTVAYENAPEGDRLVRSGGAWSWRPAGATDFPVVSVSEPAVRTFVLPDAPAVTVNALERARDSVLLAGYTFESASVVDTLCALRKRAVEVRVLLEREPVGGLTTRAARGLDALSSCGVAVSLLGGSHARFSYHHAKYAIVDSSALVLSENWKPSGVGGHSNRGWGVLIEDADFAGKLAAVFETDRSWRDVARWRELEVDPVEPLGPPAATEYPARFEPANATPARVDLLLAPDNAEEAVVDLLDGAQRSISIQQVAIGSRDHPFVNATLGAARRGVRVRVLLSSAEYAWRENAELVDWLNRRATEEGLPLRARLVEPRSRFERVHNKGVIVDDAVVVGSLNWNAHATRKNREVAVVLHGRDVAGYYRRVFRADWRGGMWRLPLGALGVVLLGVGASAIAVRRMTFDP